MDNIATAHAKDGIPKTSDNANSNSISAHTLFSEQSLAGTVKSAVPDSTARRYLPQFDVDDFEKRANTLLKDTKLNDQGGYTQKDLSALLTDPKITGEDAVVADTLYLMFQNTPSNSSGASGGDSFTGTGGDQPPVQTTGKQTLSWGSINDLARPRPTDGKDLQALADLTNLAMAKQLDRNHDGLVSLSEMQKNPEFAALVKDDRNLNDLLASQKGGLPTSFVQGIAGAHLNAIINTQIVQSDYQNVGRNYARATTHALYGDSVDSNNAAAVRSHIKLSDIDQGDTGDCYFESALAGVVSAHPEIVSDAIKDNKDGSYTVTFKGDQKHPVTIQAPTDAELAMYTRTNADGVWPSVMEKAYAQYSVDVLKRPVGDGTNQDAISGGSEKPVLELLTGHSAQLMYTTKNTDIVQGDVDRISLTLAQGHTATMGIVGNDAKGAPMYPDHAYTVMQVVPPSLGGGVVLRNPWGRLQHQTDEIHLSADQLAKTPLQITVETGEANPTPQ